MQLGRTDEAHIIRTIEYWDMERKRYPQYDHCAVIVAEDISSRFLNVIGLFNGTIPLIAVRMQALKVGDQITLVFTTVLDELTRGLDEDDDDVQATDRSYWEDRGSKATVAMTDDLLKMLRELDPTLELKYNKFYIGLCRSDQPDNFVVFSPRKNSLQVALDLTQSDEIEQKIESSGLDSMEYDKRGGRYRLRLAPEDLKNSQEVTQELMKLAYV